MSRPDAEIVVSTGVDDSGLISGLAKTDKEVKKLSDTFKKQVSSIKQQEAALAQLKNKLDAIAASEKTPASLTAMESQLRRINADLAKQDSLYAELVKKQEQAERAFNTAKRKGDAEEISRTKAEMERLGASVEEAGQKFDSLFQKSADLSKKLSEAKLSPENSVEAQALRDKIASAEERLNSTKEAANETKKALNSAFKNNLVEALNVIGGKAKQVMASVAKMAGKVSSVIGSGIKSVSKFSAKAVGGIGRLVGSVLKLNRASKTSTGLFQKMGQKLAGLFSAAFVFNVISKGLRDLSTYFGGVLKSNQEFAKSLNSIKVNLLTAFAPLWETIQPSLLSFMNVLSGVTFKMAQFVALLSGKTLEQARASAEALNNQSKALKDTEKQAKRTAGQLSSLDELAVISRDSEDDSSDSALDFSEIEPPSSDVLAWLDKFSEKLTALTPDLDYFFSLGSSLGEKISGLFEGINWNTIQAYASSTAQKIASFLNGAIDGVNWGLIGATLGEAVNTVLAFANDILVSFDWKGWGNALANFLGSAIGVVRWEQLGQTIGNHMNGVLNFLYAILTRFDWGSVGSALANGINSMIGVIDWGKLGSTISEAINSAFKMLHNFISTFKWVDTAKSLAEGLTKLTDGIKWQEIGQTIADGINGVLSMIYTFFTSYDWGKLGRQVAQLFNKVFAETDWVQLGRTLASSVNAVLSFIYETVTTFNWRSVGTAISDSINGFFTEIDWAKAGMAFSKGILGVLNLVGEALHQVNWQKIGEDVRTFLTSIDWNAIILAVGEIIYMAWEGALDALSSLFAVNKDQIVLAIGAITMAVIALQIALGNIVGAVAGLAAISSLVALGGVGSMSSSVNAFAMPMSSAPFTLDTTSLPHLAAGAVLPPNRPFAAVVGDQRSGVNVETPVSTIGQEVDRAVGEQVSSLAPLLETLIEVVSSKNLTIDGRDLLASNERTSGKYGIQTGGRSFRHAY